MCEAASLVPKPGWPPGWQLTPLEADPIGDPHRLLLLRSRLQAGRALRAAAVGGSSTAGHALPRYHPDLYHQKALRLLNASHCHPDHEMVNSGTPATGPQYMEKCLQSQLPADPDLVFVEFAQNVESETDALALERLLRRLLELPSVPAVVLVNLPTWRQLFASRCAPCVENMAAPRRTPADPPAATGSVAEVLKRAKSIGIESALFDLLAAHYRIPSLSLHRLLLSMQSRSPHRQLWAAGSGVSINATSGWYQCSLGDLRGVGCTGPGREVSPHPNQWAHQLLASAIVDLILRRKLPAGGRYPPAAAQTLVPPPLFHAPSFVGGSAPNYALASETCIVAAELRAHVVSAAGWAYEEEGSRFHPKPGIVSQAIGARLRLCYPLQACGVRLSSERAGRPALVRSAHNPSRSATAAVAAHLARPQQVLCPELGRCLRLGDPFQLALGYLQSYDHRMGGGRLSCEGGCSCSPQTLSGRHAQHTSTTAVAHIKIRLTRSVPAPFNRTVIIPSHGTESGYQSAGWGNATLCPCTLSVENIKGPEWLGTKFKVSMMMLADNRGKVRWVDTWKTQWLHIGDSSQRTARPAGQ